MLILFSPASSDTSRKTSTQIVIKIESNLNKFSIEFTDTPEMIQNQIGKLIATSKQLEPGMIFDVQNEIQKVILRGNCLRAFQGQSLAMALNKAKNFLLESDYQMIVNFIQTLRNKLEI